MAIPPPIPGSGRFGSMPTNGPTPTYPGRPPVATTGPTGAGGGSYGYGPSNVPAGYNTQVPQNQPWVVNGQPQAPIYNQVYVPPTPAQRMAAQYDAWLQQQQASLGDTQTFGINTAQSINDINNTNLFNSTQNQLALNSEAAYRNTLSMDQNAVNAGELTNKEDINLAQYQANTKNLDQQYGIQQQQWAQQAATIQKAWGIADAQQASNLMYAGVFEDKLKEGYGFAQTDFKQQVEDAKLRQGVSDRAALSSATSRGAVGARGTAENFQSIADQSQLSQDVAANNLAQRNSSIGGSIDQLHKSSADQTFGYQGQINNLQNQMAQGQLGQESNAATYAHDTSSNQLQYENTKAGLDAQLSNNAFAKQGLESLAKEYGIRATDMQQSLLAAVQKNNLNLNQVIQQMNTAYQTGNQAVIQQFNQLIAGINAQ